MLSDTMLIGILLMLLSCGGVGYLMYKWEGTLIAVILISSIMGATIGFWLIGIELSGMLCKFF